MEFTQHTASVAQHVQRWQQIKTGKVDWEPIKYRSGTEAISMPVCWRIHNPSEWIEASGDKSVQEEFHVLEKLAVNVSDIYRELLIRERSLWRSKSVEEVITTAKLADNLSPGAAHGRPLRLLNGFGIDTKFFERNSNLLTRLLDERYNGAASEQGLHLFLDAHYDDDHWVLLAPLSQELLPFRRMRLTTSELKITKLPSSHILVVENEQCFHLLPELSDTIAILGAGMDLQWLTSPAFDNKNIGYWGDMDTWGLLMLANVRRHRPDVTALLMNQTIFEQYATGSAVKEPVSAQETPPEYLTATETNFYRFLLNQSSGRLEQEYIPVEAVAHILEQWTSTLK
jgi:hypothetical protein